LLSTRLECRCQGAISNSCSSSFPGTDWIYAIRLAKMLSLKTIKFFPIHVCTYISCPAVWADAQTSQARHCASRCHYETRLMSDVLFHPSSAAVCLRSTGRKPVGWALCGTAPEACADVLADALSARERRTRPVAARILNLAARLRAEHPSPKQTPAREEQTPSSKQRWVGRLRHGPPARHGPPGSPRPSRLATALPARRAPDCTHCCMGGPRAGVEVVVRRFRA